jgi:hypothetical protein
MAIISALINLPVGIRFAALTKDGVVDLWNEKIRCTH